MEEPPRVSSVSFPRSYLSCAAAGVARSVRRGNLTQSGNPVVQTHQKAIVEKGPLFFARARTRVHVWQLHVDILPAAAESEAGLEEER